MSYEELNDFFIPELELKYSKGSETPKVTEKYNSYRVWLLFAKFTLNKLFPNNDVLISLVEQSDI